MLSNQLQEPGVHRRPDRTVLRLVQILDIGLRSGHVTNGHHDLDVQLLVHGCVDDRDGPRCPRVLGRGSASEELGDDFERTLRGGQAYSLGGCRGQLIETFETEGEVGPSLGSRQRMDLIDDHGLDRGEDLPRSRGEHQVQALGSRDQQVRRVPHHGLTLFLGSVARAHGDRDVRGLEVQLHRLGPYACEWSPEVPVHVVCERLQRRHIKHSATRRCRGSGGCHQRVQRPQERGERLARARRCVDQRVCSIGDRLPPAGLRWGGRLEDGVEPTGGCG